MVSEGTFSRCGKTLRKKRPANTAMCECYCYCPLCGAEMTLFNPGKNPKTNGAEEVMDLKGQSVASPGCGTETILVCHIHSPPFYSSQKSVEVKLL